MSVWIDLGNLEATNSATWRSRWRAETNTLLKSNGVVVS